MGLLEQLEWLQYLIILVQLQAWVSTFKITDWTSTMYLTPDSNDTAGPQHFISADPHTSERKYNFYPWELRHREVK